MATIIMSINVTYETKDGVDADKAVHDVTANMWELLHVAGIDQDGKPATPILPLFCPKRLAKLVEIVEVKPLLVVGPK